MSAREREHERGQGDEGAWSPEYGSIDALLERALAEDLHAGDVTTAATVTPATRARAVIVAKAPVVVAGIGVARRAFARVDDRLRIELDVRDGDTLAAGARLLRIEGPARSILAAERTVLNLLQRMCGIATITHAFVTAAAGRCRITDTRKTTPGLRALERYAVRCGGGHNHRNDLGAAVLIKENHIRCAGGIAQAVTAARARAPHTMRVECEVTDRQELEAALAAGVDGVLLDNMSDDELRDAVECVRARAPHVVVEASGGVELERVPVLAELGVDVISAGVLTHSVSAGDISLLVEALTGEERSGQRA